MALLEGRGGQGTTLMTFCAIGCHGRRRAEGVLADLDCRAVSPAFATVFSRTGVRMSANHLRIEQVISIAGCDEGAVVRVEAFALAFVGVDLSRAAVFEPAGVIFEGY